MSYNTYRVFIKTALLNGPLMKICIIKLILLPHPLQH
nr:MAG TPA: hypothetical protein [Caudoviricetes sp.]